MVSLGLSCRMAAKRVIDHFLTATIVALRYSLHGIDEMAWAFAFTHAHTADSCIALSRVTALPA